MSKIGKTKKDILNHLSKKRLTLSELSEQLELSPSTIKQHLEELETAGAIEPIPNEFIKRWKYYRVNPDFNMDNAPTDVNGTLRKIFPYAVGSILVIVLVLFAFSYRLASNYGPGTPVTTLGSSANNTPQAGSNSTATDNLLIKLTDPPTVPQGTQALIINYSSVRAYVTGANGTRLWVSGAGGGTVNLMSLLNTSQIIGNIYVGNNALVNKISFNVTSAKIMINNTDYGVIVPNNTIDVQVFNPQRVNSSSSVLVDLSTTIATMYSTNSTRFVMLPSVSAVVEGNIPTTANLSIGKRYPIDPDERKILAHASQINITSDSVVSSNGMTSISVTVRNTGNSSVMLDQLMLTGDFETRILASNSLNASNNSSNRTHIIIVNENPGTSSGIGSAANCINLTVVTGVGTGTGTTAGQIIVRQQPQLPPLYPGNYSQVGLIHMSIAAGSNGTYAPEVSEVVGFGSHAANMGNATYNSEISGSAGWMTTSTTDRGGNWPTNGAVAVKLGSMNLSVGGPANDIGLVTSDSGFGIATPVFCSGVPPLFHFGIVSGNIRFIGIRMVQFHELSFAIAQNGTLFLPPLRVFSRGGNKSSEASAFSTSYSLSPGQSVTLKFNGSISFGNGLVTTYLTPNDVYGIVVQGNPGAFAAVHANASV